MDNSAYIIRGREKLCGDLNVYSAKNCVLALMAAALLCEETVVIKKCPKIIDVMNMQNILEYLGCSVIWQEDSLVINCGSASGYEIPDSYARELRGSVIMLGSILGRFRKAAVALPGGCDIGLRPIDLHIKGLRSMGVEVFEDKGAVICDGKNLKAGTIRLQTASVGATENLMLAAALAKGVTVIHNAAREPEITALQDMLNSMGAKITGAGSTIINIEGVNKLHGTEFTPIPDRIVAGTYIIAAAITGGTLRIYNCNPYHLNALITNMCDISCKIRAENHDTLIVNGCDSPKSISLLETMPYPLFPTDLQAPVMALQTVSDGVSVIVENMFETRFRHVGELVKMGADITVSDRRATVKGVKMLHGANVAACELRGGAALVLAALAAEGETTVSGISHINRGYMDLEKDLQSVGADIRKV